MWTEFKVKILEGEHMMENLENCLDSSTSQFLPKTKSTSNDYFKSSSGYP